MTNQDTRPYRGLQQHHGLKPGLEMTVNEIVTLISITQIDFAELEIKSLARARLRCHGVAQSARFLLHSNGILEISTRLQPSSDALPQSSRSTCSLNYFCCLGLAHHYVLIATQSCTTGVGIGAHWTQQEPCSKGLRQKGGNHGFGHVAGTAVGEQAKTPFRHINTMLPKG